MKRPSVLQGIVMALGLSLTGGALFAGLTLSLANATALKLLIALLGLIYVAILLRQSSERAGRLSAIGLYLFASLICGLIDLSLPVFLIAHAGLVWLVRSLYFYASLLPALMDLGLTALGLAAAVWAANQSHSFFLSVWSFFLVQALFVVIPKRLSPTNARPSENDLKFNRAYRSAESALRRIHSRTA